MTHSPPIPPGNQSPYPIKEPPHDRPTPTAIRRGQGAAKPTPMGPIIIGGATIAVVAATAAVLLSRFWRQKPVKKSISRRPVRKTARVRPTTQRKSLSKPASPKLKAQGRTTKSVIGETSAPVRKPRRASADDKRNRGPQDASRVAMGEDYEVRYWTEKFGVDREGLQRAVDAVGNGAAAVEAHLRGDAQSPQGTH